MSTSNKLDWTKIQDITSYEGYLWYSNEKQAFIVKNGKIDASIPQNKRAGEKVDQSLTDNDILQNFPFVVEGALYSEKEQQSIEVRHLGGQYIVNQVDLTNSTYHIGKERVWLMNKDNAYKLKVADVWEAEVDKNCEEMQVLKPAFTVFKGLK